MNNNENRNNNIVQPTRVNLNKVQMNNNDTFLNRERDNIVSATIQANEAIDQEAAKEVNNEFKVKKTSSYKTAIFVFIALFLATTLSLSALVAMKKAEKKFSDSTSTTVTTTTRQTPEQIQLNYLKNTGKVRRYQNSNYILMLSPASFDLKNNETFYMLIRVVNDLNSKVEAEYGTYTITNDNNLELKGTNVKGIKTLNLNADGLVLDNYVLSKNDNEMKSYTYTKPTDKGILMVNGTPYNEHALYIKTDKNKTTYKAYTIEETKEFIKLSDGTSFFKDGMTIILDGITYTYNM